MSKAYVFYNPLAGGGKYEESLNALKGFIKDETILCDITHDAECEEHMALLKKDDYIVVCGGDGTLNRFVNKIIKLDLENDVLYFPCGSGNDFAREFGKTQSDAPFSVRKYIKLLPTVTVNGKEEHFINGIGYGLDGYCCETGDKLRATTQKPVNYTAIAIKGLLFYYKPTTAKVTVDGKTTEYKKAWIAPTMHGKYYGGGMMPAPDQTRDDQNGDITVTIVHSANALRVLTILPSIFKGEHVKFTKHVTILKGKDITVEFDQPRTIHVDGETIPNVTTYTAHSALLNAKKEVKEAASAK